MDLSSLKKALLHKDPYPHHPPTIQLIETHISLVFLTGDYVYKVKKPVNFGFLDFTTLEKRQDYCQQEVTLNRRLAPRLYLGVVPITEENGQISVEGTGATVEVAVKMKQMPEDFLMDRLLKKNEITPHMLEAVSATLARFYAEAETNDRIQSFARPERIKQDTDENFEQTEEYIGVTLSRETYQEVREKTNRFLQTQREVFDQRIREERIRDCHGDLRLEHIFWGEEISIFDCIEFNERFRYTDVAADISFLAMDLDYHGREDLSDHFVHSYMRESGDHGLTRLLDFYKCYRAYVRGKVESFRLKDPSISSEGKQEALERAQRYFHLASQYATHF